MAITRRMHAGHDGVRDPQARPRADAARCDAASGPHTCPLLARLGLVLCLALAGTLFGCAGRSRTPEPSPAPRPAPPDPAPHRTTVPDARRNAWSSTVMTTAISTAGAANAVDLALPATNQLRAVS